MNVTEFTSKKARAEQCLKDAGLRPTRQRLQLYTVLFGAEDRHVTPEMLHAEARSAGAAVSLATVYNTLNQFTESGLLRRLTIEAGKTYFDTNTSTHHHFFDERTLELIDVPESEISCVGVPAPPEGKQVEGVEIVVRIR